MIYIIYIIYSFVPTLPYTTKPYRLSLKRKLLLA